MLFLSCPPFPSLFTRVSLFSSMCVRLWFLPEEMQIWDCPNTLNHACFQSFEVVQLCLCSTHEAITLHICRRTWFACKSLMRYLHWENSASDLWSCLQPSDNAAVVTWRWVTGQNMSPFSVDLQKQLWFCLQLNFQPRTSVLNIYYNFAYKLAKNTCSF